MRPIKLLCAEHRQKYSQLTIYMSYIISDVQIRSLGTLRYYKRFVWHDKINTLIHKFSE